MDKWDKLNKEFDDALDSMTLEDWNRIKKKNNMTAEQFTFWLQGFMEINDPETLGVRETQIIKDHLKLVFDKQTPDRSNMTEIVGVPNSTQPIQPYDWSFNPKPYNPYTITCTDSEGYHMHMNDPNKKIC